MCFFELRHFARHLNFYQNVFLVGGFAESPYLQGAIRRSLEAIPELPKVELRTPDPKEPGAS
jgi:hypothetical protein